MNVEKCYTKYEPNPKLPAILQLQERPSSSKCPKRLIYDDKIIYKPFLVNTKLLAISSEIIVFGLQTSEGQSTLKEIRIFTIKDHNNENNLGEVKEEDLDAFIKKIFLENGPKSVIHV